MGTEAMSAEEKVPSTPAQTSEKKKLPPSNLRGLFGPDPIASLLRQLHGENGERFLDPALSEHIISFWHNEKGRCIADLKKKAGELRKLASENPTDATQLNKVAGYVNGLVNTIKTDAHKQIFDSLGRA